MDMEIDEESPIPRNQKMSSKLTDVGSVGSTQLLTRISESSLTNVPETSDWSLVRQSQVFNRQYARAYHIRLTEMRPILETLIKEEWTGVSVKKISALCESHEQGKNSPKKGAKNSPKKNGGHFSSNAEIAADTHAQHITLREDITVAILGTIFKIQPEKPSILQELVEEIQITTNANKENFVSEKDILMMEDETTRVRLIPSAGCGLSVNELVNGVVCAVKGRPNIDGMFEVKEVIWATPKPTLWPTKNKSEPVELIFVSGLQLGQEDYPASLGMLFEYLQGSAGSDKEREVTGKRTRVFFLGNSFSAMDSSQSDRFQKTAEVANKFDVMLSELSQSMEVFIVSGKSDPAESMYPQPPLHPCLFPQASKFASFHLLSNPTRLPLNISKTEKPTQMLDIVFSDGETVMDAMRYSDTKCPLRMAQKLLQWGHICPTAPDTLTLHPGVMSDIFILKSLPNMFVFGNQKEFGITEWNKSMIVSVPSFATTGTAVVFTKDFDCIPMEFNVAVM